MQPLEEYLIKLGFSAPPEEYRKFTDALGKSSSSVNQATNGIARQFAQWQRSAGSALGAIGKSFSGAEGGLGKFGTALGKYGEQFGLSMAEGTVKASEWAKHLIESQTAVIAGFTAVAGAVVGTAFHIASEDQRFRILGERMMLGTGAAKKLSIALDALGTDLTSVAWDKELHQRFATLIKDQDNWQKQLGGNFEQSMVGLRNLRFEFTRLQVALKYLGMRTVESLFERFGITVDGVQAKIEGFLGGLNIAAIGDEMARYVVPILKQTWVLLQAVGEMVGVAAAGFTNFIGILSGDESIEGTTFSFQKLAGAIEHVTKWAAEFAQAMTLVEKLLFHVADAAALALTGRFKDAVKELKAGLGDLTPGSGGILGLIGGAGAGPVVGGILGAVLGGPAGAALGTAAGAALGPLLGLGAGAGIGALRERKLPQYSGQDAALAKLSGNINVAPEISAAIQRAAQATGLPPSLLTSLAKTESSVRQYDNRGNPKLGPVTRTGERAIGLTQLMPGTARELGVNPNNAAENALGGARYLKEMLTKYGDLHKALMAYNEGPGNLDYQLAHNAPIPASVERYASQIIERAQNIEVGDITVHVTQPNATAEQIGRQVHTQTRKAVREEMNRQTSHDLSQLVGAY